MMKENAIPKATPRKVKGTVLFTVVCVMMVLTVFLLGTLALAATANNRAMQNYSQVQTQTSANAAVNSVIAAIMNNEGAANAALALDAPGKTATVDVQFQDAAMGKVSDVKLEFAGSKWLIDTVEDSATKGQMVKKPVIKVSATVTQGKASSTVAAYVIKGNVEANTEQKDSKNNGFVTTGDIKAGNHVSSFGGTYVGFAEEYKTLTDPNDPKSYKLPADNVEFLFGNGEHIETDAYFNGSLNVSSGALTFVTKAPGSGVSVWGNLFANHNLFVESVNATETAFDDAATTISYNKVPYIYVEKAFVCDSNCQTVGGAGNPLNIFCGSMQVGNNMKNIYADVYCNDENGTSVFKSSNLPTLYKWSAKVVEPDGTSDTHTAGSFYTKGDLVIESKTIFEGDVYVGGDLYVPGQIEVGGSLTVKGKVRVLNGGIGMDTADKIKQKFNITNGFYCDNTPEKCYDTIKYVFGHYELDTANGYKEVLTEALNPDYEEKDGFTSVVGQNVQDGYNTYDLAWVTKFGECVQKINAHGGTASNIDSWTVDESGDYTFKSTWGTSEVVTPPKYTGYVKKGTTEEVSKSVAKPSSHYENAAGAWVDFATSHVFVPAHFVNDADVSVDLTTLTFTASPEVDTPQPVPAGAEYPGAYEKDVILGLEAYNGKPISSTQIVKTVYQVMKESDPFTTEYNAADSKVNTNKVVFKHGGSRTAVQSMTGAGFCTEDADIESSRTPINITDSCTLSGYVGWNPIVFHVQENKEIWVVIDGLTLDNGAILELDDVTDITDATDSTKKYKPTGTVNILLKGDLKFTGNNNVAAISQKSIVDRIVNVKDSNGKNYELITSTDLASNLGLPALADKVNINVYCEKANHELYLKNNSMLIANIKAPYMDLNVGSAGGNPSDIYYNGYHANDSKLKYGTIGCCVVRNFDTPNNWTLFFVGNNNSSKPKTPGEDSVSLMDNWTVLYYENY